MVGQVGEVIKEINGQGTTVLLIEQNATMALSVATHAFVLTVGEVTPVRERGGTRRRRRRSATCTWGGTAEAAVDRELAAAGHSAHG